jgi:hypothetical protein
MSKIVELAPAITLDDVIATKGVGYKPDFKIHTAGIEPDRSNNRLVHMVGSSTEQDMQGDIMTLYALNDMTKAAPNMTIWLNHNYDLPGSIFGSVVGAPTIKHQQGIADLHLTVDVELDNPAAAQVKRYIDNGRRLGCSIGCMVTKYEVPTEDDGPNWANMPIKILGVYPVEYSVVGIPCNQRSWVENAISGVFTRTLDPALAPAMKSLWPSRYKEMAKSFSDETRVKMDMYEPREAIDGRIEWLPAKKMFLMSYDGKERRFNTKDLQDFFAGAQPIRTEQEVDDLLDLDLKIDDLGEDELDLVKGVCGKTSWPLDMESSWDKSTAHHHLLEWAGGKENFQASKFKSTHFWYDNDGTQISDFHYPFCDVKGGKVVAVWHAIVAAAAALGGARSGTDAGGKGAIRSRVASYYHKAGKTPPWEEGAEKDEKSVDELELTEKEQAQQELDKVAAGKPADDKKPSKDDKDPDNDGDDDTDPKKDTDHDYAGKQDDDKKDDQDDEEEDEDGKGGHEGSNKEGNDKKSAEEVVQSSELDPGKIALLAAYNTVGKSLNLPELTAEKYLEVQKAGVQIDDQHMHHLQMLHDMVCSMSGGMTCSNAPAQSFSDAVAQAQEISGNSPSVMPSVAYSLGDHLNKITKSMETYNGYMELMQKFVEGQSTVKVELEKAQQEVATLGAEVVKYQETIASLKDMPLGNPIHHNRTVHEADRDATITREEILGINKAAPVEWQAEDSLAKAFEMTSTKKKNAGGMFIEYRVWPEGVGGDTKKGVRPELTSDQITYMSFQDINNYREGKYAEVPCIGSQKAK